MKGVYLNFGNEEFELQQNLNADTIGKLGTERVNNTEVKLIREYHRQFFKKEQYWEILKVTLGLNAH